MWTLGIDLGTSGVRATVLGDEGIVATREAAIAPGRRTDPAVLWDSVAEVLRKLDLSVVAAIAVDGTSGTLVPTGADGAALGPLSLYNETAAPAALARIAAFAPKASAVHGVTSPLARAMGLQAIAGIHRILHEADWIAGRLLGRTGSTDANNALKTGYDPVGEAWPDWIGACGVRVDLLPRVLAPGAPIGRVDPATARAFGLPEDAVVCAGTTDGCASFLAAGAAQCGDAVTALGSTLTVKLLSDRPVFAPEFGVYSHRLRGRWLVGGASNTGGAVLAEYFTPAQLAALSGRIDPARDGGLNYYPLVRPGERFPIADPDLPPRLVPRPPDDAAFLHGLLQAMAEIEALGYRRLASLGAPSPRRVFSTGGGAANPAWTALRARALGVPVIAAASASAALGAAMLAQQALRPEAEE